VITLLGAIKDLIRTNPSAKLNITSSGSKAKDQDRSIFELLGYASQLTEKKEIVQAEIEEKEAGDEIKESVGEDVMITTEIHHEKNSSVQELPTVSADNVNVKSEDVKEKPVLPEKSIELKSIGRFSELMKYVSSLDNSEKTLVELKMLFKREFEKGTLKRYEYDMLIAKLQRIGGAKVSDYDENSVYSKETSNVLISSPFKESMSLEQAPRSEMQTPKERTKRLSLEKKFEPIDPLKFPKLPPFKEIYDCSDSSRKSFSEANFTNRKKIFESAVSSLVNDESKKLEYMEILSRINDSLQNKEIQT
jgi:hypothetical protein